MTAQSMAIPVINLSPSTAVTRHPLAPSTSLQARTVVGGGNKEVSVTECRSWNQLEEWIPGWEAILRENRSLSVFSTPEWLGSWWKAFGSERRMLAFAFSTEDQELVALAPFYFDHFHSSLFGGLAHLRLIGDGSGDSDNLDLIARRGFEERCARALLCQLREHQNWDICSLSTVAAGSLVVRILKHELERANWPLFARTCPSSAIQLPGSWAQYVEQLSPNFRPLVTRYPRKLASRYQVRIRRCESPEDLAKGLEILFSLHTKRWNLANQSGSFGSDERKEFYQEMSHRFLQRGWLELWLLELNGIVAAAQFCFRYNDTVSILQEGFDPQFAADKVGYALRAAMLKHFIEIGVQRYDFLGGIAAHKQNWGAKPGEYLDLRFARPQSIGSLYLSCTNKLAKSKEWLRENLPASAWNVLHRLNVKLKNQQADVTAA
jgi:CelD/BcsL family acetyltransferase involved in cellulose biosynthesis